MAQTWKLIAMTPFNTMNFPHWKCRSFKMSSNRDLLVHVPNLPTTLGGLPRGSVRSTGVAGIVGIGSAPDDGCWIKIWSEAD